MSGKEAFTKAEYLAAAKKRMTDSPSILATELGTTRQSVYRFNKKYPEVVEEGRQVIASLGAAEFSINMNSFENFQNIPSVLNWVKMYERKMVAPKKIKTRQRQLWYMCRHLNVHPMKVTPEQVAEVIVEMRDRTYRNSIKKQKGITEGLEKVPLGLSYYSQREAWRGYMQMIRGVSGQIMSDLGVDAHASFGFGSQSRQRLTKAQRMMFKESLVEVCRNPNLKLNYNHYLEGLAAAKFMYYTGTRRAACVDINFEHCRFELTPEMWLIEVIDKGQRGGIKWEKILIGQALKEMKEYVSERFKITENLETEVPKHISALFPSYYNKENLLSSVYRRVHDHAGIKTTIPVHIFRHTFAQDCLDATDWNYEMVATLGGWKNTTILKQAYGEMGRSPKIRGLRKAMGLPVEEVKKELIW